MKQKTPYLLEIFLDPDETTKEGYNNIYEEKTLSQIESYYLWLLKVIRPQPGARMVDIACGNAELVRLAGQSGVRAVGIDISEMAARHALQLVQPHASLTVSTGEELPFADGSFDIVTNIGSLEHFNSPAVGAAEMARVLKPGGRAYVLVPNTFSILSNVWNAMRKGITSIDDQPIQRYGARMDWECLLEGNGLRVLKAIKHERPWPYDPADWNHYLRRPKELVRLMVGPFIPTNLAFCFLFVCEPK